MLVRLRREYWLSGAAGFQLVAVLIAIQESSRAVWQIALGLVAVIALFAWLFALRRSRAIGDMPTSKVASAAQGYVEIVGAGRPHEGGPLLSPYTHLPCLWYRYFIYRKEGDKWVHDHSVESDSFFELDDGTGRAVLDPEGAEILSHRKEERRVGEYKHVEYLLLENERLYALGQFRTVSGSHQALNAEQDVGRLLDDWKWDQAALRERFDLDGDGEISQAEWALARHAARREVGRQHDAIRAAPALHYLEKPMDGRLFLISNISPERLGRQYGLWAWFQLALLVAAGLAVPWLG